MQILESSMLGLRAARHRLTSPSSPAVVTLFPMVHIGEAGFFARVRDEALGHDLVFVEGVRSPVVRQLTRSYRWIDLHRLGLVLQPRLETVGGAGGRIVHADLTGAEFQAEWRKVPLWLRWGAMTLAPLAGLKRRLFATRETLAARLTMDDRLSSEELLAWDPRFASLQHSILGARDRRLVERLSEALDRPPPAVPRRIAIVYGAAHMRAVLAALRPRGFRSVDSDWLTIFSL